MLQAKEALQIVKDYPLPLILKDIEVAALNGKTTHAFNNNTYASKSGFLSLGVFNPKELTQSLQDLGYKVRIRESNIQGQQITNFVVDWSAR